MSAASFKRNIIIGVTGSVAAYKSVELGRLFITAGFNVRFIMTSSAQKFITPLLLESATGSPVMTDMWEQRGSQIEHIEAADWADLFLIAPATADIIAKLSYGFSDSALLASALATRAPILIAPAMNVNMYENRSTTENIERLKSRGVHFANPAEGMLACGWKGMGRLAELNEIFCRAKRLLAVPDLEGKRVLVSTGPTREPLDPVRFISNRSSGKMGIALANEAYFRGAEVTLVHGPVANESLAQLSADIRKVSVTTAEQMKNAMLDLTFSNEAPQIVVMAAAVSDYKPKESSEHKTKKSSAKKLVELELNDDILSELGKQKGEAAPYLVGFAVETGEIEELLQEISRKLQVKNVDLIVGNLAEDAFGLDTNRVWLLDRHGRREEIATSEKTAIAAKIFDAVVKDQ